MKLSVGQSPAQGEDAVDLPTCREGAARLERRVIECAYKITAWAAAGTVGLGRHVDVLARWLEQGSPLRSSRSNRCYEFFGTSGQ